MKSSVSPGTRAVVLAVILGAGSGVIAAALTSISLSDYATQLAQITGPVRVNEQRPAPTPVGLDAALVTVRQADFPAVAKIFTSVPDNGVFENDAASASGTVLTSDGWVLTAVAPGTSSSLASARVVVGGKAYAVKEVVADTITHAVFLKIDASNLPVIPFGDPASLLPGQSLFVVPSSASLVPTFFEQFMFATSLAANADLPSRRLALATPVYGHLLGLGGAPVTNANGELVGVFDPFGFAVPSPDDTADIALPLTAISPAIRSILSEGKVIRPSLGATVIDLSRAVGLSTDQTRGYTRGALVDHVPAATPAFTAGLKTGDIILEVSGAVVNGERPLDEFVAEHDPGDAITLLIDRDGDQQKLTATLVQK